MAVSENHAADMDRNQRYWDETAASVHGPLARGHWARPEPCWGLWSTPESQLAALPENVAGMTAIELGCGTAYVSSWLARSGARPAGIDISPKQLATARAMQEEFDLGFPLLLGDAEHLPLDGDTFDLAISEYGAALWCDPYRWIPEAARVLKPGGHLVFLCRSPLFALCAPPSGQASTALLRPQFGLHRLDRESHAEFTLPHGEMVRLLRSCGFMVEDLIEMQAPQPAHRDYAEVSAGWAHHWPSEEIWKATLAA
jgi:SAM-dependent methyltransferase